MARPPKGQVLERKGTRGTMYALRFRAYGKREYVTLGSRDKGWTAAGAAVELENVLADVRRGIWRPSASLPIVEVPIEEPTFHALATDWVERRRHEVDERTVEHWRWALSGHLLRFFADLRPSAIDTAAVERYKLEKLREREALQAVLDEWTKAPAEKRGRMPARPLSNASVNKTLKVLAQVLDDAVELGYLDSNPARGKRRRLKASKPRRTWLELHEVNALLGAAGKGRPILATMLLGGLRVGEMCSLRWRDVDLAAGKLVVADAKTDAGERVVDLSPELREDLTVHRADAQKAGCAGTDDYVFGTSRGTRRNRSNVTRQILAPAIERASAALVEAGRSPLDGITNHSLRRTFASLLYEAGASPAYVMGQMGHTDPALALEIYTKVVDRKRDVGARMDALVRSADWARMGTSESEKVEPVAATGNEKRL